MEHEKRRHERKPCEVDSSFNSLANPVSGPPLETLVQDISEGGIRLKINKFVPLGTEMFLQIQLGTEKFVYCYGKVMWAKQLPHTERYEIGMEFMESSAIESRSRIRQLVAGPVT